MTAMNSGAYTGLGMVPLCPTLLFISAVNDGLDYGVLGAMEIIWFNGLTPKGVFV